MTDLQQFLDYEYARRDEHAKRRALFELFKLTSYWTRTSQVQNRSAYLAPTVMKRGIFDVIDDTVDACARSVRGFASTENLVAYVVYNHDTGANDLLLFTR